MQMNKNLCNISGSHLIQMAFLFISVFYHFPTEDSLFNRVKGEAQRYGGDEWRLAVAKEILVKV
ncbi:hypothetical protein BALCAV_0217120 [Alkalihalobacillus alcalophilus ATCC 27647 = CGMCC 1.3604]|uniref:Uncharacterized protein n=1 Tax=Alkalihalobacillus alcalophilus ATCC 27647 = CGMCC 1.3604 TaxID=1218173 RepID=A0A094WHN3_ALKAL|nr:hypothetical protein BALCAV_0217120 [Alkalihalobacillus alcalophilus ATCC 27647 = CGMCC 1.3604]